MRKSGRGGWHGRKSGTHRGPWHQAGGFALHLVGSEGLFTVFEEEVVWSELLFQKGPGSRMEDEVGALRWQVQGQLQACAKSRPGKEEGLGVLCCHLDSEGRGCVWGPNGG